MPNYSYNRVAVKGTKENVIAWLNKGLANDKRELLSVDMSRDEIEKILNDKLLSLESFIPMPQTYHDFDTTNSVACLHYWLNGLLYNDKADKKIQKHFNKWLYGYFGYDNTKMNFVGIKRLKKLARSKQMPFVQATKDYLSAIEDNAELMSVISAGYQQYKADYEKAKVYQKETYGLVGWCEWRHAKLGCKWDAEFYNVELKKIDDKNWVVYLKCDTPWNIPTEWLKTMQEENNETLLFYCRSEEESGLWNGYFCCKESSWREDHESCDVYTDDVDDEQARDRWEELCTAIDRRFEDDVECMFETIEKDEIKVVDDDSNTSDIINCSE